MVPGTPTVTATSGSPRHALVIDGHAAVRTAFSRALESLGWETATARDGAEALRHIRDIVGRDADASQRSRRVDLVIMDLVLPRTDGYELLRRLRDEVPTAPAIIVLGSLQEPTAIDEVLHLGASDYIPKPFDLDVLLHKICTLLGDVAVAPFHWAPLRARTVITVDGRVGTATALSETGVVIELPGSTGLGQGQTVPMESDFFDPPFGLWRHCRGRVVSVTRQRDSSIVELAFIALSQAQLHKIRRFTVAH